MRTAASATGGSFDPIRLGPAEAAQRDRFDQRYKFGATEVAREIERRVCGCDYGATSWTTREEADRIGELLAIDANTRLLDLGAGSGWPALHFAKSRGCQVTLAEISDVGLGAAVRRAKKDGLTHLVETVLADAAETGLPERAFDVVTHSDLLCCLPRKREVLAECRRVIGPGGRMAFTVIEVAPGVAGDDRVTALKNGPEYIGSDTPYDRLLGETGWRLDAVTDLTGEYLSTCRRQLAADEVTATGCVEALGKDEFLARVNNWRRKQTVLERRLIRRNLYLATVGD